MRHTLNIDGKIEKAIMRYRSLALADGKDIDFTGAVNILLTEALYKRELIKLEGD